MVRKLGVRSSEPFSKLVELAIQQSENQKDLEQTRQVGGQYRSTDGQFFNTMTGISSKRVDYLQERFLGISRMYFTFYLKEFYSVHSI